jgi:hypothetical protein
MVTAEKRAGGRRGGGDGDRGRGWLADPDVDRALFGRLEQVGVNWVRSAILRDRVGADGTAIVPADLRAELADYLSTAVLPRSPHDLANTDTGDPEFELLRVLAGAQDPGLAIPAARVMGRPLEAAVRQHLDSRPGRWRIMVRRLMAAGELDYAQLADLVAAVGREAGEDGEGEP